MKKVYIGRGYNSWNNKECIRAFKTEAEASNYIEGLTDPKIQVLPYRSTVELVNALLIRGR